ncbi:acyl-CoA thioesterase [Gemmatimonadota bacterium]
MRKDDRLDAGPVRPGEHLGMVPIRVRYAETDAQAVVYHSNYFVYFEVGRTDWMLQTGIPYSAVEERGFGLFIAEGHIRYLKSARYDDELIVETRLSELRTRSCTFHYCIRKDGEEETMVEGWTALVCMGPDGKVTPLPSDLIDAMRATAAL